MQLPLPEDVQTILRLLTEGGYAAYVVGGCVRDLLHGDTPHDYDICTSATPDATAAIFAGCRVLETGRRHGTLTVLLHDVPYEITTFRRDGDYFDHRHPNAVTFTTDINDDLSRRDFTINAMAYSPDAGLLDPFGGAQDLSAGCIRCVGDPDIRFAEDALRILRALRFAAKLGFAIDDATKRSMHAHASLLQSIAPERISEELNKFLSSKQAGEVLASYPDILGVPIPEILPCVGFDQQSKYHHLPVWEHICLAVQNANSGDPIVLLALLLHDIAKPACFSIGEDGYGHSYGHPAASAQMADAILHRLRYDGETIRCVVELIQYHDTPLAATRPSARRWLNRLGQEQLFRLLAVKRADASAHKDPTDGYEKIRAFTEILRETLRDRDCFSLSQLHIDGRALLSMGVPQGKIIGNVLSQLLAEVMDGTLENTETALMRRADAIVCKLTDAAFKH